MFQSCRAETAEGGAAPVLVPLLGYHGTLNSIGEIRRHFCFLAAAVQRSEARIRDLSMASEDGGRTSDLQRILLPLAGEARASHQFEASGSKGKIRRASCVLRQELHREGAIFGLRRLAIRHPARFRVFSRKRDPSGGRSAIGEIDPPRRSSKSGREKHVAGADPPRRADQFPLERSTEATRLKISLLIDRMSPPYSRFVHRWWDLERGFFLLSPLNCRKKPDISHGKYKVRKY